MDIPISGPCSVVEKKLLGEGCYSQPVPPESPVSSRPFYNYSDSFRYSYHEACSSSFAWLARQRILSVNWQHRKFLRLKGRQAV